MGINHKNELPIRSKMMMREDIVKVIYHLHQGERSLGDISMNDLKMRAIYLDDRIQQDVMMFAHQVYFQYDYDPWHNISPEVQKAADRLLEDL